MSGSGLLTMDQVRQWQQYQQQQQMAQALMGNNANATSPYAGVANLGGDLTGAMMLRNARNRMLAAQDSGVGADSGKMMANSAQASPGGSWLSNLLNFGGS